MEVESPKDAVAAASDLEEEEEEGKNPGNFLERMSRRDRREVRRGILQGGEAQPSPRLRKYPPASSSRARGPIHELNCSKDLKDFMLAEHTREFAMEKEKYNDVPENQIAKSIIHRFRTHQANANFEAGKAGKMKKKASSRKKPLSSVELGSGQDSEESEVSIQEFDEAELKPPAEGSFSLSPSPRQLRSRRNLLVRFTADNEAIPIANGPGQVLRRYSLGNEEEKDVSKAGRKSKRKSPGREKKAVVEVEPRKTPPAKRRKLEEIPSSPVTASSGSKAVTTSQGDTKTKKTVTINSQPEFFSSGEPADEFCPEEEGEEEKQEVRLKSILKKSPMPEEAGPPTPSPQPEVVTEPASQERSRPVKVNLLGKFNEVRPAPAPTPLSDENFANLMRDMEKIHHSPNVSLEEEGEEERFLTDLATSKVCGGCGGEAGTRNLSRCGQCQTVAYCDETCQRSDWARHKLVCPQLATLRKQEREDGKSRKEEKKDLIKSVMSPGPPAPATNPVKTPSPSTPETSPTLAQSVRTQSTKRSHRKRFLTVLSDETKENFQDVKGLGIQRNINFAAVINDEVVEEEAEELLRFGSSSLDMSGGSSSPRTDQKEEEDLDPPSSFEILSDVGSQKVSCHPLPFVILIHLLVLQGKEDLEGLFSDLEPSPENADKPESQKILNYYKICH